MIYLSSCCSPSRNYKHLEKDQRNHCGEEDKMEEEVGVRGGDVALNVEENNNKGGGIWRGSSYDFLGETENVGLKTAKGVLDKESRGFDFREGKDPPSKIIADFSQRERISGQKSLDMEELQEGKQREQLTSVLETHTVHSEANSPKKGVVRLHVPSPNASMNARSPLASMKVQFEFLVQIGSPVYEGGTRYNPKENLYRDSDQKK